MSHGLAPAARQGSQREPGFGEVHKVREQCGACSDAVTHIFMARMRMRMIGACTGAACCGREHAPPDRHAEAQLRVISGLHTPGEHVAGQAMKIAE